MPKIALLRIALSGLLLLACLVNHAVSRLPIPQLRLVPIDRLPQQVGNWTLAQELPIEAKVRAVLPDAAFLSRIYRDPQGRTAQLFLETSQDAQMFHSPTQCMPAQNWNILDTRRIDIQTASVSKVPPGGTQGTASRAAQGAASTGSTSPAASAESGQDVAATEMEMQSAGQNMLLLYWYTSERQLDKWQALKTKLLSGRPPTRLFVRILVPASADFGPYAQTARDFAQSLLPVITELAKAE